MPYTESNVLFFKNHLKTDGGVERFIKELMQKGGQNVHTPFNLCREMIGKLSESVDLTDKKIAVLFNIEFLHVLINDFGINPENICMFADDIIEYEFCRLKYKLTPDVNLFLLDKEGLYKTKELINMKFDVVLMNPPYHVPDGGHSRSSKSIYHQFIEYAVDKIQPNHLLCVCPSRWMMGGKGLDNFRKRMMNDTHIKLLVDDMSCSNLFPSVEISGGVNYFVWDKNYKGPCNFNGIERNLNEEDIVIRENESRFILSKVKKISKNFVGESASPSKPYGLRGDADSYLSKSGKGVPCWFKQSVGLITVNSTHVKNPRNDIHLWRVLAPRAPIAGQTDFSKPIGFFNNKNVIVAKPGEYCSETYIVLKALSSEIEAKNFISYLMTRFFRFMLRMRVISQDITRDSYNWVPDLDNYLKSWTDDELFSMFDLSESEQEFIKSKIK